MRVCLVTVCTVAVIVITLQPCVFAGCNGYTGGPVGSAECVKITHYNQYQWATCLTDADIKQKSGGKYKCSSFATYCYYQCQLDVYQQISGNIYGDCQCEAGDKRDPTLPSECYSPPGNNCEWYRNCLNKYKNCSKTDLNYAIDYGYYFCKAYDKSYSQFTDKGRSWVDATRRCLQVALVPLLRLNNKPSCLEIYKKAFDSHTCCYVGGSACVKSGTPSVCFLPFSDCVQIVTTIYESFLPFYKHGDICKSLEGLISTITKCSGLKDFQGFLTWIDVQLFITPLKKESSSVSNLIPKITNSFMKKLPYVLEARMETKALCYAVEYSPELSNRKKRALDTNGQDNTRLKVSLWETPGTNSNNLKEGVKDLLVAIQRGAINFEDDDELMGIVKIKSAAACKDSECKTKDAPVIPITAPSRSGGEMRKSFLGFSIIMTLLIAMLNW